jgi:hypothetical protein
MRSSFSGDVTQRIPTFRDNLLVPSSRVKQSGQVLSSWTAWQLKIGQIPCPETSVNNYPSLLRNIPEEQRSHFESWSLKLLKLFADFLSPTWTRNIFIFQQIRPTNTLYLRKIPHSWYILKLRHISALKWPFASSHIKFTQKRAITLLNSQQPFTPSKTRDRR